MDQEIDELNARQVSERDVSECLHRLDPVWEELYPLEQTRIIQLLVERVIVTPGGMNIRIRTSGIHSLVSELKATTSTGSGQATSGHEERICEE